MPRRRAPSNKRERLSWTIAMVIARRAGADRWKFPLPFPSIREQSIRANINPPDKTTLNLSGDAAGPPCPLARTAQRSPSQRQLGRQERALDSLLELRWTHVRLPGTDGAIFPFWSPDGRSLGFFADGQLKTIDLNGDSPQAVCAAQIGRGGGWGPDGVIHFLSRVSKHSFCVLAPAAELRLRSPRSTPAHTSHRWPVFLPDGKHFPLSWRFITSPPSPRTTRSIMRRWMAAKIVRLFHSQSNAIYANGYLLFVRGDQLMAQPFDPANGTLSGEPRSLAKGVMSDVAPGIWTPPPAADGLLVFGSGGSGDLQLIWVDRNGKQIGTVAEKLTNLTSRTDLPTRRPHRSRR
jgi:hypothetical protein